ncbi:MAG: glycosyltransferase family 4 protein [Anaerolineae bacterium]
MRIGLITGEYPPDRGGVGDFTAQLGHALAALGHQAHIITSQSPSGEIPDGAADVAVHRVVQGWGWRCWGQVIRLAEDLALDVLDVQYQAAAYGMHPAINVVPQPQRCPPVVATFHDLKVPYLFPKAGPLRWWVVRMLARRAAAVVVTNREDFLRLKEEIDPRKLNLIPIGSNIPVSPPAGYDRDAERARWGLESDDVLLGYFGFLNQSKGGEELIRALEILVKRGLPAHLLRIGGQVGSSDPTNRRYAERVERLIAERGLAGRVHRTGYASPAQVSAALLATDVCVLPYRDGVSFRRGSLLACLAHGRAVVTTRPGVPLPEIEDGGNMVLVAPDDAEELADSVEQVSSDPGLRTQLERGAEALAAGFTWERIARRTAAMFEGLARDGR